MYDIGSFSSERIGKALDGQWFCKRSMIPLFTGYFTVQ